MTDPSTNSEHNKMLVELTVEELRSLIREELAALNAHGVNTNKEML